MALANRRTTILLLGIAVVFTIVLIIQCLTPSHRPRRHAGPPNDKYDGRTPTPPKDVINETTTTSTITPTSSTTTTTTETITTTSTTTETSTTKPESTDVVSSSTITEKYIYHNTSTSEPTTESYQNGSDTTTGHTVIEVPTSTSTTTEESTELDQETTTKSGITDAKTTDEEKSETTTEEIAHTEDTTAETTDAETHDTDTTDDGETSSVEETTSEGTTTTSLTTVTPIIKETENETECSNPDCKKLAARMLDMMDHSASPCKDFYQFACGGVEDDPFLHPEDPNKNVYDKIIKALQSRDNDSIGVAEPAKTYFKSCIDKPAVPSEEDLSLLKELVSRHGLLDPRVVDKDAAEKYASIDEDAFDLQSMLADFIKHDFAPFFEVGLDVDKTDDRKFSVRLSLPLNGFDSGFSESIDTWYCKSQYEKTLEDAVLHKKSLDINSEYEKLHDCREKGNGHGVMIDRLKEASKALYLTGHIDESILADKLLIDTTMDAEFFLVEIKEAWPSFSDIRHQMINKNYTEYRVADLDSSDIRINKVKWSELLEAIVGRPVDKVQVYHEQELMGVFKRIAEEADAKLRNMLLMMWASRLYTDLVAPAASTSSNTAQYCGSVTQYLAPDMAALIFLQSFPEKDLKLMNEAVEGVVSSVKRTITAALELTEGVSRPLRDKLLRTVAQVGAFKHLDLLNESIAETNEELSLTGSYVSMSLDLLKRRRKNMYSLLNDQTDSHTAMWNYFSVPYSVTATTLYRTNNILIPEAVMAPPLMYPSLAGLPKYLLYAGIGHLVAHEFLHAMDTTGIKFDALTGAAMARHPSMDEQEYCLNQFLSNNFTFLVQRSASVSFQPHAHLYLNELMADTGATRLAWLAYIHGETVQGGTPIEFVEDPPSRRRRRSVPTTESHELPLPWLNMTPYQVYLLRTAQTQCARTSNIDVIDVMEKEHLPPNVRVNLAMIMEPLFAEAFQCPDDSVMNMEVTCPYAISHVPDDGPPQ